MKLFSNKQIFFTTILAGPLPAAYLLSKNYLNIRQRRASLLAKILGFFFAFLTYILTIFSVEKFVIQTGIFQGNNIKGYGIIVLFFLVVQAVMAGVFAFISKKNNGKTAFELSKDKNRIYSFIHVIPFVLLGIAITIYLLIIGSFRFILLVIYLLPNIYLHNHIKKIFVSKQKGLIFTTIFIVLVGFFPLLMIANNFPYGKIIKYVQLIAYYYLPILLYGFLFYVFFDIILLINRKIKFIPKKILIGKRFRMIIFSIILLITTAIVTKGIFNYNNTQVSEYSIGISKKMGNLEHLKITMAADIHFSEITNEYFVKQFIDKINSMNPDIVLLAGDNGVSSVSIPEMKFFEEQLRKIKSKYGVYAVEGNHELSGKGTVFNFFKNANIKLLRDTVIKLENSFFLVGRKDRNDKNRKSIEELLKHASDSLPRILLDHQPYNLEMAYNNNIDVQLSGHTHHGQLFPINYITEGIYELSWGYRKIQNTHFFVTCGAQGWGPQVKTASHSEIMEINIDFE
ncbi:MAG: metallophosphoesterase [Bacteroidota bacterium]